MTMAGNRWNRRGLNINRLSIPLAAASKPVRCKEGSPDRETSRTVQDALARPPQKHRETSFALVLLLDDRAANDERGVAEATDWMKPPSWSGNFWGPAATVPGWPDSSRRCP